MRKLMSLILVLVLMTTLLVGCGGDKEVAAPAENNSGTEATETETPTEEPAATSEGYADGIYFAQEDGFAESGWKYAVTLEVQDGKIVSADWNGANINGGEDKDTVSASGAYGMVEKAGAQAEWHEQAALAEAYLVENQSIEGITLIDDEGHTDAIAGVSIHVGEFTSLVEKALAKGPVGVGPYPNGAHYAEDAEYGSSGWKETVSLTVINGYIVAANWNGVSEATDKDKKTFSIDGEYGMVEKAGAQAEWHEQAALAEAYLIENQSFDGLNYTDDEGHTDTISGVSIHVNSFERLAKEALNQ